MLLQLRFVCFCSTRGRTQHRWSKHITQSLHWWVYNRDSASVSKGTRIALMFSKPQHCHLQCCFFFYGWHLCSFIEYILASVWLYSFIPLSLCICTRSFTFWTVCQIIYQRETYYRDMYHLCNIFFFCRAISRVS